MSRWWDVASLAVVVAVVVAHVSFLLADGRLPQDPGLYYKALPDLYEAWRAFDLSVLASGMMESSGWYNAMVGLVMAIFGVSPLAFSLFDALWVGLILLGVVLVTRQLHSPAAALAAVCLVGAMPVIFLVGRTSWIHTPETALVLLAVAAWLPDRTLSRWRSVAILSVLGALTIALRPSGLIWVATLVPLLVSTGPRRWGRIAMVLAVWGASVSVPMANMSQYMAAKASARDRYAAQLPHFFEQVVSTIGVWPIAVVVLGLLALVGSLIRKRPDGFEPMALLLPGWAIISLGLWVGSQAGIDNFPLIGPALAILAGWGLARLSTPLVVLAVPIFLAVFSLQWIPSDTLRSLHRIPGANMYIFGGNIRNHYRVYQQYGWKDMEALLAATCPEGECVVGVDQGLLEPFTEDVGELELFLVQADNIRLINIREGRLPRYLALDALVEYHCQAESDLRWRERFPDSIGNLAELMEHYSLQPVWSRPVSPDCEVLWLTPEGTVAVPSAVPPTGVHLEGSMLPERRSDGRKPPLPGDPPLPEDTP